MVLLGLSGQAATKWRELMMMDIDMLRSNVAIAEMLDEHDEKVSAEVAAGAEASARATDILRILDKRCVVLTVQERERITACTDLETLDRWFDSALNVVTDVVDFFNQP
jgi:hypothetical protein